MSKPVPVELQNQLRQLGQEHLLTGWENLSDAEVAHFVQQLETIDFEQLQQLYQSHHNTLSSHDETSVEEAMPPENLVRLPVTQEEKQQWQAATVVGKEILAAGKVGIILVAGGQGTRLGFPHPKGMFPIGPVSERTLFQHLIEQAIGRGQQAGVTIPYFVMTSDATHEETITHFAEQNNFGIAPDDLFFFKQGNMPAVDTKTGKLLLEKHGQLCLSPDGHGGMVAALGDSGLLSEMQSRGIEYLYYHQVDNPTAIVCDPAFLGFHQLHRSEMSTKVAAKRNAKEKMGVVVSLNGITQIIEYSDLPDAVAAKTDEENKLLLWAGNMAIHLFNRSFLEQLNNQHGSLPFHVAHKEVPCINATGEPVKPTAPNANKFERFIFDALFHTKTALVVEANRQREFNPVKNEKGNDSPETSRVALTAIHTEWLTEAGIDVPKDASVEISPLFALDATGIAEQIQSGKTPVAPHVIIGD